MPVINVHVYKKLVSMVIFEHILHILLSEIVPSFTYFFAVADYFTVFLHFFLRAALTYISFM